MSVYVDPLTSWGGSKTFRWTHSCHMYADTTDELHTMAVKIGLREEWFQDEDLKHYDLTRSKRIHAVKAGALEKPFEHMVKHMRRKKK